ncbi:FAD:protein FMN transferase [Streptomyces sp. 3MP-14]|uniref:FAD:protein FMN transferase n=1 Tax=Streptomyces mimosae TaxID=2586635 RepID=A0A5N6A039_9ACTN|nr:MULTISPECIES: FAD:protein FMN transferase [Streptomyces]KAB8162117.1 FAD:protein FMN transferase [Streptomyces mimosae]KAB8173985.1 FAD:protein FMN transferase [Streptomyces sp. 3MP-14]
MRVTRERVMGTELLTVLPAGQAAAVLSWLRDVEATFSRFVPDSDVSRANAGAGRPVAVSDLFLHVLTEAVAYQRRTGGLFSPFLGAELVRLGYTRDFAEIADVPARVAPPAALDDAEAPEVRLDLDASTVQLTPGVGIDLGGFVKGWSVQAALDGLAAPRCLIDAGGDLVARRGADDPPWRVGVEHPLTRTALGVLELPRAAAVATSSVTRRAWRGTDGARLHHIVDPRTGQPAASDCLQATVLADDLAAAEVWATCLTILGTTEGSARLAALDPAAHWLTVDTEGTVRHSPNLPFEATP